MKEAEFRRWMLGCGFSLTTIERAMRYVKYIEELGLRIDEVESVDEVLEFFAELRMKGKSEKTINNYVKQLNRYFKFRGLNIKLTYFKEYRDADIRVPTDEDVRRILSVTWGHYDVTLRNRTILYVFFSTGIRVFELINLDQKDLFYDNALRMWILKIRMGKGRKPRQVPVPPKVVNMIYKWYRVRPASDPNAIFTTPRGRISHAYLRKIVKDAGAKAGVPWFHAHLARHWRALKWLEEGLDLETIRELLGHASLKTTQVYLRGLDRAKALQQLKKKDTFFGRWDASPPDVGAPPAKIEKSEVME